MMKINQLNFQQSKHLVERAGLGVELDVIESFVGQSLNSVITRILSKPVATDFSPPELMKASISRKTQKEYKAKGKRMEFTKLFRKERRSLQVWGLQNLLESENPLHERMVWFWHNHFTSSAQQVRPTAWMIQQDQSIRKYALGDFSTLLSNMSFDPAMLIYLDGRSNKKGQPNENFARELLELFTLGEGHYTENDIKEAARAFTGWSVNNKKDKVIFRKKLHDDGVKSFMGKEGKFTGQDILGILLQNNRTAEFIAEKLWYEFVSTKEPDQKVIKSWANSFLASDYDIAKLLKTVFESEIFWDEKYRGTLIKSPIDIVVGSLRTFNLEDKDLKLNVFLRQLRLMGQDLYMPPNVKGWEGGKAWVDDDSLLRRQNFLQRIMRGQTGVAKKNKRGKNASQDMSSTMTDSSQPKNMMASMNKGSKGMNVGVYELPDLSEKQWAQWLLPIPAITPIKNTSKKARLRAIVLDPAYQLK